MIHHFMNRMARRRALGTALVLVTALAPNQRAHARQPAAGAEIAGPTEAERLTDLRDPRFQPTLPRVLNRPGYRPAGVDGKPIASCHLAHIRVRAQS
jgi:hypothetical protein